MLKMDQNKDGMHSIEIKYEIICGCSVEVDNSWFACRMPLLHSYLPVCFLYVFASLEFNNIFYCERKGWA